MRYPAYRPDPLPATRHLYSAKNVSVIFGDLDTRGITHSFVNFPISGFFIDSRFLLVSPAAGDDNGPTIAAYRDEKKGIEQIE